jgi:hypothetical protein
MMEGPARQADRGGRGADYEGREVIMEFVRDQHRLGHPSGQGTVAIERQGIQAAFAKMADSKALVELPTGKSDAHGEIELALHSAREMVEVECGLTDGTSLMSESQRHGVNQVHARQRSASTRSWRRVMGSCAISPSRSRWSDGP